MTYVCILKTQLHPLLTSILLTEKPGSVSLQIFCLECVFSLTDEPFSV